MRSAWALASLEVLEDAGWDWVHERAATLAARLADRLRERGLEVGPRGRSTLVSWKAEDPEAEVARLAETGIVVRSIPAFGWSGRRSGPGPPRTSSSGSWPTPRAERAQPTIRCGCV